MACKAVFRHLLAGYPEATSGKVAASGRGKIFAREC